MAVLASEPPVQQAGRRGALALGLAGAALALGAAPAPLAATETALDRPTGDPRRSWRSVSLGMALGEAGLALQEIGLRVRSRPSGPADTYADLEASSRGGQRCVAGDFCEEVKLSAARLGDRLIVYGIAVQAHLVSEVTLRSVLDAAEERYGRAPPGSWNWVLASERWGRLDRPHAERILAEHVVAWPHEGEPPASLAATRLRIHVFSPIILTEESGHVAPAAEQVPRLQTKRYEVELFDRRILTRAQAEERARQDARQTQPAIRF